MKQLHENGSSVGGGVGRKKRKNEALRPNVYVYAAVLNACAYSFGSNEEKEEALRIGINTYEELQRSADIETNHVAYGSFIRVCRRLMAEEDPRRGPFRLPRLSAVLFGWTIGRICREATSSHDGAVYDVT